MLSASSRARRGTRVTMAAVLAAGLSLTTGAAAAASASRPAGPARAAARGPALTLQAAQARARATGRPAVVASMTTPTSQTVAEPDGKLRTRVSLEPVRAWSGGAWRALNPTLHRVGGRISPAVTADSVSLSGGGTGPLVEIDSGGYSLSLAVPSGTRLPVPTLNGPTATYSDYPAAGASLALTVTTDGQVSSQVAVPDATVAALPAIQTETVYANAPVPGTFDLQLAAAQDPSGGIAWQAEPTGDPAFTASAAQMWDSTPLPAGASTYTDPATGTVLAVPSGFPAVSGPDGPGAGATVTSVPVSLSGSAITLAPPASALTGSGVTYPVFIHQKFAAAPPEQDASAWTQVDSGYASESGYNLGTWHESGCLNGRGGPCLQTGFCDPTGAFMGNCGQIGVTRTLFRMPLPDIDAQDITVASADLYLENVWTAACDAQPLQVWTTGDIRGATTWNSASWDADLEQETFKGYGTSCTTGYSAHDVVFGTDSGTKSGVTITGGSAGSLAQTLTADLNRPSPAGAQTFGLRAASESTTPCRWDYVNKVCTGGGSAFLQWRQFMNTSESMELDFTWYDPPQITMVISNPGGSCDTNPSQGRLIGNDDINDLQAVVSDKDGDTGLATTFKIYTAGGVLKYTTPTPVGGTGAVQNPAILRSTIQNWQLNGSTTAYTYYYTVATSNRSGQTTTYGHRCYFRYDPVRPGAPQVTGFNSPVHLGDIETVTFKPNANISCATGLRLPPPSPDCPQSYSYQIGALAPVTVSASTTGTWDAASDTWTGNIAVPVLGPFQFQVSDISTAGNPSTSYSQDVVSTQAAPLADGYFSAGAHPDLLITGSGADPSLWLARGSGNGTVAAPTDIGGLGNGINPGTDGPGDWKGALILHGDLTGHGVQDMMAYWPASTAIGSATITPGTGEVIGGVGGAVTANPTSMFWAASGNEWNLPAGTLCDPMVDATCVDEPVDLVAAGDASQNICGPDQQGSGHPLADLIGIVGFVDTSNQPHYHLALYTGDVPTRAPAAWCTDLSAQAPDLNGWNNYTLATAQLPDSAHPNGDPANTVLLALDKANGNLWESQNPFVNDAPTGQSCSANPQQSTCDIIGSTGAGWTQIGVPWATSPPQLISADVNAGTAGPGSGSLELWTRSGNTATSWTLVTCSSGTCLKQEATSSLSTPGHDWPLTDGGDAAQGPTATTATDTITGTTAQLHGGAAWNPDDTFGAHLSLDGSTSYLTPPAATIPDTDKTLTIEVWFKTTTADGVIASVQGQAVSPASPTTPGAYNPVLYVGNDGKLHAEWWHLQLLTSASRVDDGLWHHAILSAGAGTETLTLDGQQQHVTGTPNLTFANPTNLTFGAGYIGGSWPDEPHQNQNGNTGYLDYFRGQIASITLSANP